MNPIEYQSFSTFDNTIRALVAPEGLGEELIPFFRDQIGNALADIQTLIPWFRAFNVDVVEKGGINGVSEFCNASIFQGPIGKVTQVFAYKPGLDCRKYYYKRTSPASLDCWMERQRCLCPSTNPSSSSIYDSPYCNYVIAGETACETPYLTGTEDDCRFISLSDDDRIYSIGPDYKMYVAPRFPCGYNLLVHWQGVRRSWGEFSQVPVDQQLREAVVNYVEHKMALKERQSAAMSEYFNAYTMNLKMLNYRYHDEQDTAPQRDCTAGIEQLMALSAPLFSTYLPVSGIILSQTGLPLLGQDGQPILAS